MTMNKLEFTSVPMIRRSVKALWCHAVGLGNIEM